MTSPVFASLQVTRDITNQQIQDSMCNVFETGISSWYRGIVGFEFPEGIVKEDFKSGGKFYDPDNEHLAYCVPFVQGCSVKIRVDEEKRSDVDHKIVKINLDTLKAGLTLLAEKCPRIINSILEGQEDASDSDIFLQFVVYGQEVYN